MPETALTLTDALLRRVRDPQGSAHSRVFVRTVLTHCQRLVNAGLRVVLVETTLTTEPYRQVYPLQTLLPSTIRVQAVREGGRDLHRVTLPTLNVDRRWFRRTASRFHLWAQVGHDMLIVHPAKLEASSVVVVSAALTNIFTGEDTVPDLPDYVIPAMLALAEGVLLARSRNFAPLAAALRGVTREAVAGG